MLNRLVILFFICTSIAVSQTYLGNYSRYVNDGTSVTVFSDTASIRLTCYADDIVRIDYFPSPTTKMDSSFVVLQQPSLFSQFTIIESNSSLSLHTSKMQISFQKYPLRLTLCDSTGKSLATELQSGGVSFNGRSRTIRFAMDRQSHFFGTGERGTSLDKRGQKFTSYNTQVGGYSDSLQTMNLNVPFIATPNGYAFYIDNTYRGEFDFGAADPAAFSYSAEGGEISLYCIVATSIPEQLERFTWLTGRQPLPPRWIFGFTQSKNRYMNEAEARAIVRTMREKEIPCDAIVLDLAWFKNMGDISWNEAEWPEHEQMITDFLSKGIKTILITEPYIVQPSKNFSEADSLGYLAKSSTGKTFLLEKWWSCNGCNASLLDLTNPNAQQWWWSKHPSSFGKLTAGIWTDLGEPEKHPESMVHYLGAAVKIHNIFNLLWAKTIFDGFNQLRPNERVVNLTRSGFAGIQRYGVLPWSGDVSRSFGGLAVQMPMLLNMGMSGIAYHNSDIGGYARNPTTPELYIRWMQYGVFCPITRAHGAGEVVKGSPTEPWQFGEEAERINREYIRLRYRLLPYNYSLAYQNYRTGLPLARPLFWSDMTEPKLINESSSYMWGDAFLISPVVSAGQRTKSVYLPKGRWINFWTDSVVAGGRTIIVETPIDRMPIFVKAGNIVPTAPVMNFSDEHILDTLTLHLYPDPDAKTQSEYSLYEDDGKTLEYQKGKYAVTKFVQDIGTQNGKTEFTITVSPSEGSYSGKVMKRDFVFEVHTVISVVGKILVNQSFCTKQKKYIDYRNSVNSYYVDPASRKLYIHVVSATDSPITISIPQITFVQSNEK